MSEQDLEGRKASFRTWASIKELRSADEVWIHCSWKPCLWWATLWGKNVHWVPECSYDPIRRAYHGWKKTLVGTIERFCLRRAKVLVATCEAEADWIRAYLGRRCPPVEVTDIKRFFNLTNLNPVNPVNPVKKNLHLLYLGRRHPLKGLDYLLSAIRQLDPNLKCASDNLGQTYIITWQSSSPIPHLPSVASKRADPPSLQLKVVSNAFGDELEKVWDWCDVLVLPTLSDNFGLVIAEALERGKRVITTDGAPAWGDNLSRVEVERGREDGRVGGGEILFGYNGRLIYLKGYRDGSDEQRVELLKRAIKRICE